MKSNVVLIGFMGTGKTTVGKILADKLGKEFLEMDKIIEKKANKSIPEIFSEDGEIKFRELEMEVAKELSGKKDSVIAAGGGVVLNKLNIDYLKRTAEIILLKATPKDIYDRISLDGKEKRPLLNNEDPMGEIKKLLEFRKPFYEMATNTSVSTHNKTLRKITEEIITIITF
ncbi:MAG: shikimate kinase [Promethearchaeota archaeon]